jgi:hypothetical protein
MDELNGRTVKFGNEINNAHDGILPVSLKQVDAPAPYIKYPKIERHGIGCRI